MQIDLTQKEFRRLLDLVYIGNWILNSTRGDDRFQDYDDLESKLFGLCRGNGMKALVQDWNGISVPSKAYTEGGIHEAIACYEDTVFYEILAEELARRDLNLFGEPEDPAPLNNRIEEYMQEFEANGLENLSVDF